MTLTCSALMPPHSRTALGRSAAFACRAQCSVVDEAGLTEERGKEQSGSWIGPLRPLQMHGVADLRVIDAHPVREQPLAGQLLELRRLHFSGLERVARRLQRLPQRGGACPLLAGEM